MSPKGRLQFFRCFAIEWVLKKPEARQFGPTFGFSGTVKENTFGAYLCHFRLVIQYSEYSTPIETVRSEP